MDNATFFTAYRPTHAKIVVVALASIAVCLEAIRFHAKPMGSEPPLREHDRLRHGGQLSAIQNPVNSDLSK